MNSKGTTELVHLEENRLVFCNLHPSLIASIHPSRGDITSQAFPCRKECSYEPIVTNTRSRVSGVGVVAQ